MPTFTRLSAPIVTALLTVPGNVTELAVIGDVVTYPPTNAAELSLNQATPDESIATCCGCTRFVELNGPLKLWLAGSKYAAPACPAALLGNQIRPEASMSSVLTVPVSTASPRPVLV